MTKDEAIEYGEKIMALFPSGTKIKDVSFVLITLLQAIDFVAKADEVLDERWGDRG